MIAKDSPLKPLVPLRGPAAAWFGQMVESFAGFEDEPHGLSVLSGAALSLQRALQCSEVVARDGVMLADRFGAMKPHPLLVDERASWNQHRLLCRELGIPPAGEADPGDGGDRPPRVEFSRTAARNN